MKMFFTWQSDCCTRLDGELKILKELNEMALKELDLCTQFFISEVRKVDGELYPHKSIEKLLLGFNIME